jgi:type IV pilus assembly protein PilP
VNGSSLRSRPLRLTALALGVAALVGCARGDADLRQKIDEIKAQRGAPLEPPPVLRTFESFTYQAQALRDPFGPSRSADSADDSGTRPDMNRPREPLENFPLDALDMVGTIGTGAAMVALVKDPTGLIHQVRPGNYMGQNFGRILSITETGIQLVELVPNGTGGWLERQSAVALDD